MEAEARTSSLLAELIQAAGIVPEGSSESSGVYGIAFQFLCWQIVYY